MLKIPKAIIDDVHTRPKPYESIVVLIVRVIRSESHRYALEIAGVDERDCASGPYIVTRILYACSGRLAVFYVGDG